MSQSGEVDAPSNTDTPPVVAEPLLLDTTSHLEGTVTDMSSSDALASAATLTATSTSSEKTSNRVARTAGGSNHLAGRTAVNRSNTTSGSEGGLVMVASSLATPSSRANPAEPFSNVRLHLCFASLRHRKSLQGGVSPKAEKTV